MARLTSCAGIVAVCLLCVTLQRAPLVWIDEVYFASAARSVAGGGDGIPDIEPASNASFPLPLLYGPVFFWLEGQVVARMGASPFSGRVVSLAGAILTGVAAGVLTQLLTGSPAWAMAAFAAIMLSPEIGTTSGNGRMDTLALALELSGLVAFVWAAAQIRRAVPGGLVAGALWAMAVLTTERTFPFGAAVAGVTLTALAWGKPFDRKALLTSSLLAGGIVLLAITLWAQHWALSPVDWLRRVVAGNQDSEMLAVGLWKFWAPGLTYMLTPVLLAPALLIALLGTSKDSRPQLGPARFVLAIGAVAAALIMATTNAVFLRGVYFVPLLLIATLSLGCFLREDTRRMFLRLGVCGLLLFAGVRAVKTIGIFETWSARSPEQFARLIGEHVPPRSTIVGYDEFYFYAVSAHGSTFRSFRSWEIESPSLRAAWEDRIRRPAVADPQADFLLWPDDPRWPMPESLTCAAVSPVARYDAPSSRSWLDRLIVPGGLAALRRYPSTVLYRVPDGCRI